MIDAKPAPPLPLQIRLALPLARVARSLRRRVKPMAAPMSDAEPAVTSESSPPVEEQHNAQGIGLAGTGQ